MSETDDGIIIDGLTAEEKTEVAQDAAGWKTDKAGKVYASVPGQAGRVTPAFDGETVEQAILRRQSEGPKTRGRRRPDAAPRPSGKKSAKPGPTEAELTGMLEELLAMPAIPAAMILKCSYCAQHFATSAGPTARELVGLAKQNAGLHAFLVRMYTAWSSLSYGAIIAMYVGKPMLHHLAPEPILASAGPFLGVPPRQPGVWAPPEPHAHPHGPSAYSREAPNARTAPPSATESADGFAA
jgi:hypothetical protein